jgi:hypothetical protein
MARQLMASPVLRRRLAAAFETDLTEGHLDRLAILAGMHDLGKALKGFQDKLEGTLLTSRGHVAEALAAVAQNADLKNAVRMVRAHNRRTLRLNLSSRGAGRG